MRHLILGETEDEACRDDGALHRRDPAVEAKVHPSGRQCEIKTAADLVTEDDRLEHLNRGYRHSVTSLLLPRRKGPGCGRPAEMPDEEHAGVVHARGVAAGVVHAGRGGRRDFASVEPERSVWSTATFQRN